MKQLLSLITLSAVVSACVTINIYFPAAAAEKAADKVIEEVWQIKSDTEKAQGNTEQKAPEQPAQ